MTGQEATWLTADWANDVQENICQVIEAATIALVKGDGSQMLQAIRAIANQVGMPVGVPLPWLGATSTIPSNCVVLMGQTLDRELYPLVSTHALASGIIVSDTDWLAQALHRTKFSTGDGLSTIRLPDLRGELIYGADLGRGVRSAAIGDWLAGELLAHVHAASTDSQGTHSHAGTTDTQGYHSHGGATAGVGDHTHPYTRSPAASNPDAQGADAGASMLDLTQFVGDNTGAGGAHAHGINGDGSHAHNVTTNAAGAHIHNVTVSSAGGLETRQRGTGYPFIMRVK
ncbi:phage tail collar domain-containing protein [Cupriavidus basilensis OR16]|uniref:Phage tail collar domain-containing protein n=1 Tax=Cupriavidus basilensis OR16 TaxID=1127483 RepID=H1SDI4_9BURK|nr:phage tail collar domain-containing protein [Cupriavidus basilensis OR16]